MKMIIALTLLLFGCASTPQVDIQHMWDQCAKACEKPGIAIWQATSYGTYECSCKVNY